MNAFNLCIQWNTYGAVKSVPIFQVSAYKRSIFGTAEGVLFVEVSSFQGCHDRGVPLQMANQS